MQPILLKFILVTSTIAALVSIAPVSEALHSLFQTIDLNKDGKIDQNEFSQNMIEHAFKKIDNNDSKNITRTEWDIIEGVEDWEKHNTLFKIMDNDNDKRLSFDEFSDYAEKHSNIEEKFMALDKDKDDILSPDEITVRPLFRMVTIRI